jgi:hypothetical protein
MHYKILDTIMSLASFYVGLPDWVFPDVAGLGISLALLIVVPLASCLCMCFLGDGSGSSSGGGGMKETSRK